MLKIFDNILMNPIVVKILQNVIIVELIIIVFLVGFALLL